MPETAPAPAATTYMIHRLSDGLLHDLEHFNLDQARLEIAAYRRRNPHIRVRLVVRPILAQNLHTTATSTAF